MSSLKDFSAWHFDDFLFYWWGCNTFQHKEKAVHLPTVEVLQDVSATRLGAMMLLHPSKFDTKLEVQRMATEYDRVEVQVGCTLFRFTYCFSNYVVGRMKPAQVAGLHAL